MKMKATFLFLLLLLYGANSFSQTNTFASLLGTWEGLDGKGNTGSLRFIDSAHLEWKTGNISSSPPFRITFTDALILLEIYIARDGQLIPLKTRIVFLDDNKIRWLLPEGAIILRRKKQ
jgi:hypothetical protein